MIHIGLLTYGRSFYVTPSLRSLFSVLDSSFQVHIADDGSPSQDLTLWKNLVDQYASCQVTWIHHQHIGPNQNFITLVNSLPNDGLVYLTNDDVIYKKSFLPTLKTLAQNPQILSGQAIGSLFNTATHPIVAPGPTEDLVIKNLCGGISLLLQAHLLKKYAQALQTNAAIQPFIWDGGLQVFTQPNLVCYLVTKESHVQHIGFLGTSPNPDFGEGF